MLVVQETLLDTHSIQSSSIDRHINKSSSVRKHFSKEHSDIMADDFNHCVKVQEKCQNIFDCLINDAVHTEKKGLKPKKKDNRPSLDYLNVFLIHFSWEIRLFVSHAVIKKTQRSI